jgi:hypothetical protein
MLFTFLYFFVFCVLFFVFRFVFDLNFVVCVVAPCVVLERDGKAIESASRQRVRPAN